MDIRKALAAKKCESQWERGCAELAGMIIDNALDGNIRADRAFDPVEVLQLMEIELLNGAADWSEYVAGGGLLVYDEDIAGLLATPSEIRRRRDSRGVLGAPNSRETWMDVQGRAALQAWRLIRTAAMKLANPIYKPDTAFLSAPQAAAVSLARTAGCTVLEAALAMGFDGFEYYMDRGGRRFVAGR